MATALDLLMSTKEDVNLLSEESDICTIDAKTRAIFVPSTIVVGGVQSDKNAERIKFSCPKIVGDNLDLSKFSVRINFENVSSVDFNVSIKDQYICDDVAVDGENVTFSWLIGRNAARYMGTVRFIVCAVKTDSDSNISVEWNTTIAEVPVLEGIEIDQPQIGQEEKDVINQLLELTKNTSAEAIQNVNSAKEQAIKDIQSVSQPDTTLTIEGGLAEAKATGEAIDSLKEDIVCLENSKKKYIISLSKNKEPSIEWSPTKPLAHNFTSNSDGFLKMISVTTKNSGKIKIYVLSNYDGKEIDNNVGYIVRSENIFNVVSGKNSISCDIRICKGDTIAYQPVDGANVLYKDDPQGFKTYQLNNSVYLRSDSHIRFYSIDFIIESNMGYQKCIDDVYKYSVSSNLIGMDFDMFYPVDFKEQNYITVSTKDGSIFPQSSETYIGMYDKNKNFIRNFRLNNTLSYRHLALRESDKDCAYIKWNGDAPVIECMVNYGIDILPYTVYFKNAKQNESDIKKVDTTDVNYIGNSTLVSKCMEFTNLFYGDYIVSGKTAPSKTESFLFFTDPHTVEDSEWENGCRNMLQTIKNYYDSTPTSFIMCGGDWIGNSDTPDKACYKLGLIKGFMDKLFLNNYLIVGNHDTNYQGKADESSEIRTTRLSNDAISGLWYDGGKAYYSFKGNYTTFYCFDTGVENQKLEDCDNYFWDQAIWFANSLIKNESEHIIIFMHILYYNNVINQMANQVNDISKKFNNREIKYINNIPYNFSNVKGKIDFILCGHNHSDSNGLTEGGIAYAITKNAYPNGTPTFDMVMINYDNRIINLVRVGEGNSRKISMDTGELIN